MSTYPGSLLLLVVLSIPTLARAEEADDRVKLYSVLQSEHVAVALVDHVVHARGRDGDWTALKKGRDGTYQFTVTGAEAGVGCLRREFTFEGKKLSLLKERLVLDPAYFSAPSGGREIIIEHTSKGERWIGPRLVKISQEKLAELTARSGGTSEFERIARKCMDAAGNALIKVDAQGRLTSADSGCVAN